MGKDAMGGRKTVILAPNGSGKTSNVIAPAILYFLTLFPRGQVPLTSSSFIQVKHQVFPAIQAHMRRPFFANWPNPNQMEVMTPEGGFCLGFSTNDAGRVEGWHPKISPEIDPVFYVLDEAKSIPDEFFGAASRCTLWHQLIASSPGRDSGFLYECFHKNRRFYHRIKVSYDDCPHIERNDPGKKERMKSELGEKSPLYRSSILGEFTNLDGASMVPRDTIRQILNDPPAFLDTGLHSGGMDFAAGGDENVLAEGNGNRYRIADRWRDPDTVAARGRFIAKSRLLGIHPNSIYADGDGMGIPIINDLRAEEFDVMSFRGGSEPDKPDCYVNLRAEAWHQFALAIEKREIILDVDEETVEQLCAPQMQFDGKGRIKLESKEDMAKRGISSPDRADALVMAYRARKMAVAQMAAPSLNYRIRQSMTKTKRKY